ncbi:MAG: hypothetical protein R6U85_12415, partial [Salinivirgaceae bacterium]
MLSYLAKAFSIIFHPIVMPTAGIFIVFRSSYYLGMMPSNGQYATYLIVFVSTFVLPLIMISLFMLRKVVKSLEMTEKQERFVPFMVTSIFYFFSFYTLNQLNAPGFIAAYILGGFITIFLIAISSIFWKISAHMAGLGGVAGMVLALADIYQAHDPYFFIEAIIIAGLVGSAR